MKAYGVVLLVVASLGFSACSDAGPGPDNSAREAGVLPPVFPPVLLPHILSYEEVVQACEDAGGEVSNGADVCICGDAELPLDPGFDADDVLDCLTHPDDCHYASADSFIEFCSSQLPAET